MKTAKRFIAFIVAFLLFLFSMEMILRLAGDLYLKKLYVHKYYNAENHPNAVNILCLGESSTAGLWVPWQDSYPAQLQEILRKEYPEEDIRAFVPAHVGQNTSQMANRIEQYIKLYSPRFIIIMAGYNNEWSLAESHITGFLNSNNLESLRVKALILLNNFRLFKMLRYIYLEFIVREVSPYMRGLKDNEYIWGGPEFTRGPQKKFIYSFAHSHRDAFVELWRYDIKKMIDAARKHNIRPIIMTYHINPAYLPTEEFLMLAQEEETMLIRNDVLFKSLIDDDSIGDYLLWDNWHPNKKGYALIAKNVFGAIKNDEQLTNNKKKYSAYLDLIDESREREGLKFILRITNSGEAAWKAGRINAGCRIYEEGRGGRAIIELRQRLPSEHIAKGDVFQVEFMIDNNLFKKGPYVIKFDMVSEDRFWFEDARGSSPLIKRVDNEPQASYL